MKRWPVLYYGCANGHSGHFLVEGGMKSVPYHDERDSLPKAFAPNGAVLDGGFCPVQTKAHGASLMHYVHGYTVLAMWDYSQDTRPGSNAVFIANGWHSFLAMKRIAAYQFPDVWQRIVAKGDVIEVEP